MVHLYILNIGLWDPGLFKGQDPAPFCFFFNLSDPENYAVKEKLIKVKKHIFKVKINFFFESTRIWINIFLNC